MPTTTQPAAGTSIPSYWTSAAGGLAFARNEADTANSSLGATYPAIVGTSYINAFPAAGGRAWASDADGRYGQSTGSDGRTIFTGVSFGSEYTLMAIVKRVGSTYEQIMAADGNPPRQYYAYIDAANKFGYQSFDTSASPGGNPISSNSISSSGLSVVIVRVRNSGGGVYKYKIIVDGTDSGETTVGGNGTPATGTYVSLGARDGGGGNMTSSKLYFSAAWNGALSDSDIDLIKLNGWAVFDTPSGGGAILLPSQMSTTLLSQAAGRASYF